MPPTNLDYNGRASLRPGYLVLSLEDCMLETCRLLAEAKFHEH